MVSELERQRCPQTSRHTMVEAFAIVDQQTVTQAHPNFLFHAAQATVLSGGWSPWLFQKQHLMPRIVLALQALLYFRAAATAGRRSGYQALFLSTLPRS